MTNAILALAATAFINGATSSMSIAASSIAEIRLPHGGIMTRPVETIAIVTNVTHWNNEERAPHGNSWFIGTPPPGSVTKEATERTETTEIVEIRTLRFAWDGEPAEIKRERVVSRKVRRWVRRDNWVEQ